MPPVQLSDQVLTKLNQLARAQEMSLDQVVEQLLDTSDSQTEMAMLREHDMWYRSLFEQATVGVIIAALDGTAVQTNAKLSNFLGYSPEEMAAFSFRDFTHPDDIDATFEGHRQLLTGQIPSFSTEKRYICKDGAIKWGRVTITLYRDVAGQPRYFIIVIEDIDALKRAEANLEASERLLKTILSRVPVAIGITSYAEGKVLYVNALAAMMLKGTTPDQLLGTVVRNVYVRDDQRAALLQELDANGVVVDYEVQVYNPDGTVSWRLANLVPITFEGQRALLSSFIDITQRKAIEHALQESEQRYSGIVESAMDAIISVDGESRIILFNRAAEAVFGCAASDVLGTQVERFIPEHYRELYMNQFFQSTNPHDQAAYTSALVEMVGLRASGEEFPCEMTVSHIQLGDSHLYTVILRDITERKQMEQMRLETETMRVALAKERELIELKNRFISTVSHEFRTPLAMITTSAELLERYAERLSEEQRQESFRNIRKQADEMVVLMNDVLVFNKAAAGKTPFRPDYVNLKTLLQAIFEQLHPIYDPQLHHLVIDYQIQIETIWADEELLKRIFINLLGNAIKYSPAGGEVRLTVLGKDEQVIFQVSDQGIGIPPEDQQHLFEPFHRATNTGEISGTGLGLSIVRELVQVHGGDITCESRVGQGTTFHILLPVSAN